MNGLALTSVIGLLPRAELPFAGQCGASASMFLIGGAAGGVEFVPQSGDLIGQISVVR